MSKRSVPGFGGVAWLEACVVEVASCAPDPEPSPRCETASGAMAAPFTKPRLVMFFMLVSCDPRAFNSRFLYDFPNARSKILEHHRSGIAARAASDRTAGMSCCTRLIKPGDRHAVLRPAE